jgi:plastocyanin
VRSYRPISAFLVVVVAAATGCGSQSEPRTTGTSSSPGVRSAEHDARDQDAERPYTEPDGRPIAPEPQDPEPGHGTPGSQDATGGKVDVPIRDRRFTPARIRVKVGQIVVFTDDDDVPHTVRNVAGGLPHSGLIPVKGRFEYTPLRPGVVRYRCIIHPRMRGELVVLPRLERPARARRKPPCSKLRASGRHELGDTIGEINTHCRRD